MTASEKSHAVVIGLHAVIVAVIDETPHVLLVRRAYGPLESAAASAHQPTAKGNAQSAGLPFGPFDPALHRTLEIGLRDWVEDQTDLRLGYVEQLYTFGDRGRYGGGSDDDSPRVVSVGYLALARYGDASPGKDTLWQDWYRFLPWEDGRAGQPAILEEVIRPRLAAWVAAAGSKGQEDRRAERVRQTFGGDGALWDEEKVLERYELLYEASLVTEAERDRRLQLEASGGKTPAPALDKDAAKLGEPMPYDHRRILATAMGRIRGKLKYRPVVFELMPPSFTLLELQRTVESISGVTLHKQNFRRLVEREGLVEATGEQSTKAGGRPAALFRFRREVLSERPAPGVRVRGRG